MKKLFLGMLLLVGTCFWSITTYAMTDEKRSSCVGRSGAGCRKKITRDGGSESKEANTRHSPVHDLVFRIRTTDDVATILKNHNPRTLNISRLLFGLAQRAYGLLDQAGFERNINQTLIQQIEALFAGCLLVYNHAVKHEKNGQTLAAQVSNRKLLIRYLPRAIRCLSPVIIDILLTFYVYSGNNDLADVLNQLDIISVIAHEIRGLLDTERELRDHPEEEDEYRKTVYKLKRAKTIITLLIFKFGIIPVLSTRSKEKCPELQPFVDGYVDGIERESLSNNSMSRCTRLIEHLIQIPVLRACPTSLLALFAEYVYSALPPAKIDEVPGMSRITYQGIPEIDRDIFALDPDEKEVENLGAFFAALEVS